MCRQADRRVLSTSHSMSNPINPYKHSTWKWVVHSCLTLCMDPTDCSPPGSSVHGILQAKIQEWVAISSSRGSSWHRDATPLLHCRQADSLPSEPPGKPTQRIRIRKDSVNWPQVLNSGANVLTLRTGGKFHPGRVLPVVSCRWGEDSNKLMLQTHIYTGMTSSCCYQSDLFWNRNFIGLFQIREKAVFC